MILDGDRMAASSMFGPYDDINPRTLLTAMYPGKVNPPPLSHVVMTASPLYARVNHGHWIYSCECGMRGTPSPGGVVFFDGDGALLGWCPRCGNQATGHGWRRIQAPEAPLRASIEAILMCRRRIQDRNWEPNETIEDLLAQNRAHNDPVPEGM